MRVPIQNAGCIRNTAKVSYMQAAANPALSSLAKKAVVEAISYVLAVLAGAGAYELSK